MLMKARLLNTKAWFHGPFVPLISAMADSNSCALVIRLQKDYQMSKEATKTKYR